MATVSFFGTNCSYIAHAAFTVSPDPYPNGIPCPRFQVPNISTGTKITIYAREVTPSSGYGFPVDVYVNDVYVDYLQRTSVSFYPSDGMTVRLVATKTATTTYKVTFNGNGRGDTVTNVPSRFSFVAGVSISIPNTTPVRSGYKFLGWSQSSTATSAQYTAGDVVTFSGNVTLYAVWESLTKTYYGRLNLNANGGTINNSSYAYYPYPAKGVSSDGNGATISITIPSISTYLPTRDGYTFVGWARSSTATTADYYTGDNVGVWSTSTYQSSPAELVLYAVWSQTFTLSYSTSYSGVTNMPSAVTGITSGTGVTVSSKVPVLSGYTFKGWSKTNGGSVQYVAGNSIYITADVTLWTVFEKNTITLFYWNGSDKADAALIAKGKEVKTAITATRWNNLLAKIKELADACGASFGYKTVSSGDGITAARFNAARTGLANIKAALGASITLPATQSSGDTIYATLFNGSTSIKGALNALIGVYNNG